MTRLFLATLFLSGVWLLYHSAGSWERVQGEVRDARAVWEGVWL